MPRQASATLCLEKGHNRFKDPVPVRSHDGKGVGVWVNRAGKMNPLPPKLLYNCKQTQSSLEGKGHISVTESKFSKKEMEGRF